MQWIAQTREDEGTGTVGQRPSGAAGQFRANSGHKNRVALGWRISFGLPRADIALAEQRAASPRDRNVNFAQSSNSDYHHPMPCAR